MSASVSSRTIILERIRIANKVSSVDAYRELPRNYILSGSLDEPARVGLMMERLREYGAEVAECVPEQLGATIAAQLALSGRHNFAAPADISPAWLVPGFKWTLDNALATDEIEHQDGVLTTAFAGVADSGTIVLHHSGGEGRRVLSLLPDWHLCILRISRIVETLPEYFQLCSQPPALAPALATFISGPSATADIEMTRIKGVHGPRSLSVILVHDHNQHEAGEIPSPTDTGRRP